MSCTNKDLILPANENISLELKYQNIILSLNGRVVVLSPEIPLHDCVWARDRPVQISYSRAFNFSGAGWHDFTHLITYLIPDSFLLIQSPFSSRNVVLFLNIKSRVQFRQFPVDLFRIQANVVSLWCALYIRRLAFFLDHLTVVHQ